MKYRVVIKDLREPRDSPSVKVGGKLSQREAEQMLKRFTRCRWDARRPGVYTIDHIALCLEIEP